MLRRKQNLGQRLALRLTKTLAIDHAERRYCQTNQSLTNETVMESPQPIPSTQYLRRLCV